jgi:pilus assembly protein CpaE
LLVTGLLAAADLGLALNQRMTMDSMLRAGEEAAITDPGATRVRDVAINAAGDGVSAGSTSSSAIMVSAVRYCACPGSLSTAVTCSGTCATTSTPYAFYKLDADGYYASIFLPRIPLHSSVTVQIK